MLCNRSSWRAFAIHEVVNTLPDEQVITETEKFRGLVWISELGGVGRGRGCPNLYKLVPAMTSPMCRYGLNKLKFQYVDKFLVRADSGSEPTWQTNL